MINISQNDRTLDDNIQNIPSPSAFKMKINDNRHRPPSYFTIGERKNNIIYCQLRNEASNVRTHDETTSIIR